MKSERQSRIERWVRFAFPPLAGAVCYRFLGPGLWQVPAILLGFVVIALISNRIALARGGRLVTPAERWRLQMERMKRYAAWVVFLWTFLFFVDLQASLIVPMAPLQALATMFWFIAPLLVGSTAIATLVCVRYLRRQARLMDAEQAPLPLQSPWLWIRKTAPLKIILVGAAIAGYIIARSFPSPTSIIVFTTIFIAGFIAEFVARTRVIKPLPLLWSSFSFGAMLAIGLQLYAVPFALLLGLMDASVNGPGITSAILGVGGFVFGLLLAFGFWAVAKLNSVRVQTRGVEQ